MHASMHPCMHLCIHTCIYASMHASMHPFMYPCIHPCSHPTMHASILASVYESICAPSHPSMLAGHPSVRIHVHTLVSAFISIQVCVCVLFNYILWLSYDHESRPIITRSATMDRACWVSVARKCFFLHVFVKGLSPEVIN